MNTNIPQILRNAFIKGFNMPEISWEGLAEIATHITVPKDYVLRKSNTVENNIYYIITGSAGTFSTKNGKEVCLELCYDGEFFGDYASILTAVPSTLEARTLEKSSILQVPFLKLIEFYQRHDAILMEKIGRLSAEFLFIAKQQQLIDYQTLTAEERYLKLLRQRPDILQRTPMKYIASYLGITAESFSRIRKNISY
ncbi:MAG TPA: Crp/Fnr family transcriptional regulator [Patescibacteria group bacterium]|nr:Crp/Fnr family transcriptional regulator [Patescibacteria group bacterium]